jgi:transaldolase
MLARARSLLSLYAEMGVPQDKLILRVPATWAGIQAAAELEKQGIATQAFHIYRRACLAAAAAVAVWVGVLSHTYVVLLHGAIARSIGVAAGEHWKCVQRHQLIWQ